MKITIQRKISLLAVLVGAFTTLHAVPAQNVANAKQIASPQSLEEATARLKKLAKRAKSPHIQKLIKNALKSTELVGRAGLNASPQMTKKALASVTKAITLVEATGCHKSHISSSSSSSLSCEACHDISEIASDVKDCCEEIQREITEVIDFIEAEGACGSQMPIFQVPVVISEPGKYCVTSDLVYGGTGAAITVTADNVTINFQNHSLTLTDSNAQGILVQDVSEFTLENDIIQGSSIFRTATSAAVHLSGVNKATLDNLYTKNTTKGIFIEDSTDVEVLHSRLEAHESSDLVPPPNSLASSSKLAAMSIGSGDGAGIWIAGSKGVTVDSCYFQAEAIDFDSLKRNTAIHVEGASENITIKNSTFINWLSTLTVLKVDGLLVDHCTALASVFSAYHLVQLGDCAEGNTANDVIIRNSTFKKFLTEIVWFDGLLLVSGTGCLIENVIVDVQASEYDAYAPAGLHIGLGECSQYSNVTARNMVFQGLNYSAILLDSCSDVFVENARISSNSYKAVEMRDATSCTIKDSEITGGMWGIYLDTPGKNAIMNCRIYNCTTGIEVADNVGNHLSGNSVFSNENGIVFSGGFNTEAYFNTSCNNSVVNCSNVPTAQAPGDDPVYAGVNLCCPEQGE